MFSHWADFPSKSKVFHDNIAFLFWVIWAIIPDKPWIMDDSNKSNIFLSIILNSRLIWSLWSDFVTKILKIKANKFLIFMKNLCMGKTLAFTSNLCNRQTTWPKWIKFWYKKRQSLLFKSRSISNAWLLPFFSKSLT